MSGSPKIKIIITEEALADYETVFGKLRTEPLNDKDWSDELDELVCPEPPIDDIVQQLRVYLTNRFSANKYFYDAYFRVKYYDHARQQKLFLFVYKGELFGGYQEYEVRGICLPKDWNINLEESGGIRVWLNSKLYQSDERDSVMEERIKGNDMTKKEIKTITAEANLRLARTLISGVYNECTDTKIDDITDLEEAKNKLKVILRMTKNFEEEYAARVYLARYPRNYIKRVLPVEFHLRAEVLVSRIGEDVKKYKQAQNYRNQRDKDSNQPPYGLSFQIAKEIRKDYILMRNVAKRNPLHYQYFKLVCLQGKSQSEFAKLLNISKGTSTNVKNGFIAALTREMEELNAMHQQEIAERNSRNYLNKVKELSEQAEENLFERLISSEFEDFDVDDDMYETLLAEEYTRLEEEYLGKRLDNESRFQAVQGTLQGQKTVAVFEDGATEVMDVLHGNLPKYNKYDN